MIATPLPQHATRYQEGTDARNHIMRCSCGFSCSGTYKAIGERAKLHREVFKFEWAAWNSPERKASMPFSNW